MRPGILTLLIGALALAACAPASLPGAGSAPNGTPATDSGARPSRLVLANGGDPSNLATKMTSTGAGFPAENYFMSNSPLVVRDPQGTAQPRLAAELPSRDRGTWTVNVDGTMATTWKLRPGALWHDGEAVTPNDFAFALRVYLDPEVEVRSREPERFIEGIEASDNSSFTIHWKQPYPWANRLLKEQLEPLPEHVLGKLYDSGDKDAFRNASFWSSPSYIGNGPYRLEEWDKGVQMVYRAFDQYYLGRPKIDEVVFRIISDVNTLVANVLSGTVDATVSYILSQQAGAEVRQQWALTGEGQVILDPTWFRSARIQQDPARLQQPALLDVRVRRALVHAVDRATLAEIVTLGGAPAPDVMIGPNDPLFPEVDGMIAKYPFDRTRALALLQEAGWTKRGDALVNASGEPFEFNLRAPDVSENQTEMRVIANDVGLLGMQTTQTATPAQGVPDREYTASFPGLYVVATQIDLPEGLNILVSDQCARAENRFTGRNVGCWSNSEFDRWFHIATTSLDERERNDALVQGFKTITAEVPLFGTSYSIDNLAVRKGLVGPGRRWPAQTGNTWNIHEWRWA